MTSLANSDRKTSTKSMYAAVARHHIIGSQLGATPMHRVRPSAVDGWLAELRRKRLSDSTRRNAYTILRAVFDAAVKDRELVVTSTKTAKSRREVPITDRAAAILQRLRARQAADRDRAGSQWNETGYVFTTAFGEPCDPRNALRALKAAAEQASLPSIGLHTLRHSAASTMLANGVPLKVVSEIMGHSSISITGDIYGHVSPDVSRNALDVLGSVLASRDP